MSTVAETEGPSRHLPLAERLRERIRRCGPITFKDWMEAALYDPVSGYYCADRQRWGREGDYRTSPERSPLFAATFARYFARLHRELGKPATWAIVEFGCGAGHFAEGVLRALETRFPEVFDATTYLALEQNKAATLAVSERLSSFGERVSVRTSAELPSIENGIVFSNELFDAFPVHRVTMSKGDWQEFYVGLDPASESFQWIVGPLSTTRIAESLMSRPVQLFDGAIVELNLAIEDFLTQATQCLRSGYVVTVDYGYQSYEARGFEEQTRGTLRAFRRHQLVDDVLADPGEQDLTTTIDWSFVNRIGERQGLQLVKFERQDLFLLKTGFLEELEALVGAAHSEAERQQLRAQSREMILPNGMAASFQVLVQKVSTIREKDRDLTGHSSSAVPASRSK
jgi:SAM-dependent MidA family methyltransferase